MSAQLRDRLQDVLGTGYSLERELVGGGMSRVFVATETALGRRVVALFNDPEIRRCHMPTLRNAATLLSTAMLFGCGAQSTSDVLAPDGLAPNFDASSGSSGPSASGHANWINPFTLDEIHRSFHALEKDGVVEGNFVQKSKVSGVRAKGDINCLQLLSPNEAVLSGPIRESSIPANIGRTAIFRVGDGGEGSNAPPDRTSGVNVQPAGSTVDCKTFVNPLFTPIESGNIQVKP